MKSQHFWKCDKGPFSQSLHLILKIQNYKITSTHLQRAPISILPTSEAALTDIRHSDYT